MTSRTTRRVVDLFKPAFAKEKGDDPSEQIKSLANLIASIPDQGDPTLMEPKDLLCKIKILATHEDNMKAMGLTKRAILRDTLAWLTTTSPKSNLITNLRAKDASRPPKFSEMRMWRWVV